MQYSDDLHWLEASLLDVMKLGVIQDPGLIWRLVHKRDRFSLSPR